VEKTVVVNNESCGLLRAIVSQTNDAQQLHLLAMKIRDWDSLLHLAQEHRVLPMLFTRLADVGSAVPPAVQNRLRSEYERNVFHSLANAAELLAVLKAFEHGKIPVMAFKGVVLSASAYRDLTARSAGDLDLLIDNQHLRQATAILLDRGYVLMTPVNPDGTPAVQDYYEYHFERSADGMVLELRWRLELTQPRFRRNLGMDWIWPRRRTTMLAGAEIPDMDPQIALLVLCMHGSKHMWSRLLWICDVAQLLRSSPDLNWEEVVREARSQGLWRALALGVLLAHRIASAPVPLSILQSFERDTIAFRLAEHLDQNLFTAPGTIPPSPVPYSLQLLDLRDRAWFIFSLSILRPNERDRAALPLPKLLHALYYLIRPFRLFWDRSPR
jgi:hypothetical protein